MGGLGGGTGGVSGCGRGERGGVYHVVTLM